MGSICAWMAFGRFHRDGGFQGDGWFPWEVCEFSMYKFCTKTRWWVSFGCPTPYARKEREKKNCTNLANNLVEEAAREGLLDPLLEPPVWGPVGYVSLVGGTTAACEQGDNAAGSVQDDGA